MNAMNAIRTVLDRFHKDERGSSTVEFVVIFPVFMLFFLMIVESGYISTQRVQLERAIDQTTRDLRLGILHRGGFPTDEEFKKAVRDAICDRAGLIPDCTRQLELEAVRQDPNAWTTVPGAVTCVDRGDLGTSTTTFSATGSNDLMVLKTCARIDPVFPMVGIGRAVRLSNSNAASDGSYALTAITAFVVEP